MAGTFDCAVCLDYALDDASRDYFITTECGHIFHHMCLMHSFNGGPNPKSKVCPICRQEIFPNNWRKLCGIQAADKSKVISTLKPVSHEAIQYDYKFKIILVGNRGVGKTCLAQRYVDGSFRINGVSTIGCDWFFKVIEIGNKRVYLSIWDTAGQERFHSVVTNYYRDTHGVMIVYDVTAPSSYQGIETWDRNVSALAPQGVVKVLVGNKADSEEERKISLETGKALALKSNMPFFETSARDATNVNVAFRTLVAKIMETNTSFKRTEAKDYKSDSLSVRLQNLNLSQNPNSDCSC